MRQRRETVEHPFGTIKARMGATHFLMKTLPRVGLCPLELPKGSSASKKRCVHWHFSDLPVALLNVCFVGKTRLYADIANCREWHVAAFAALRISPPFKLTVEKCGRIRAIVRGKLRTKHLGTKWTATLVAPRRSSCRPAAHLNDRTGSFLAEPAGRARHGPRGL
jgi:hypothetical protein